MMNWSMEGKKHRDGTLGALFTLLESRCREEDLGEENMIPRESPRIRGSLTEEEPDQGDLFSALCPPKGSGEGAYPEDLLAEFRAALELPVAEELYSYSISAHDEFIHGWMSELPIVEELIRFAKGVITAGRSAPQSLSRPSAEQAALDRGDPAVRTVLDAAYKVRHEIHRLLGFLRFSPDPAGVYTARCSPDHFALPGMADHFLRRFGAAPWMIIDEGRSLCLAAAPGQDARLFPLPQESWAGKSLDADPWEALWRNYHRSVNNESRTNPALQRQFMPRRYWKYLPECNP